MTKYIIMSTDGKYFTAAYGPKKFSDRTLNVRIYDKVSTARSVASMINNHPDEYYRKKVEVYEAELHVLGTV